MGDLPITALIDVTVNDPDGDKVSLTGSYVVERSGISGDLVLVDDNTFQIGPIAYSPNHASGGPIRITVVVVDEAGNQGTGSSQTTLDRCEIEG